MKLKDFKKEIEQKFMTIKINDGKVDLIKFEIQINNSENIYKIIRDGNDNVNKKERPVYTGPKEAVFYECE